MLEFSPDQMFRMALSHHQTGRLGEAEQIYQQILAKHPNHADALHLRGVLAAQMGQPDVAVELIRRAVALKPHFPEARYNLGNALKETDQMEEAIAAYRQAIALRPNYADAYSNLGVALRETGQSDEAIAAYRAALRLRPDCVAAGSNLAYTLHFHPAYDAPAIYKELQDWNRRHALPFKRLILPHPNDRAPNRRLKIGYVSPDFRRQAESFFTVPLLENHNHSEFEIHCYSSVYKPDNLTQRLRQCADIWRDVGSASDDALAQIIRHDRIDILVDLTMHMGNNRALLFARKPAPVQVCWLAYPGGTGLETMDYRITDSFMDPADADTACYSEQSIRLPDCWVVYDPLIDLPPRPVEQTGPITFGSLNSPAKLNDSLLTLWAKVLHATPGSRLKLLARYPEHRQRIKQRMESLGIAADRLEYVGWMDRHEYLRLYDQIDIALDPLPYNGITTTCDALYMGTPVLTLAGQTAAGRAGKAMLSLIGLSELVAHTPEEYVQKAAGLAADLPRLIEMRRGLRQRLMQSPLMDAPRFARNIEAVYRQIWHKWCTTVPADG